VFLADATMEDAETPRAIAAAVRAAGPSAVPVMLELPPPPTPGTPAPASLRTLADVLRWQAEADPRRVHMFLQVGDGGERPITYGELRAGAVAVAGGLWARGIRRGDAVVLMLRTEEDFFYAFFGTLLAGGVPVPIYPPARLDRLEEYAQRYTRILNNAEARLLITFRQAKRVAGALAGRVPSLGEVAVVERLVARGAEAPPIHLAPGDPALIQYTSGSTGEPKGVLLSHANIMANISAIARGITIGPDDVGVSWLPLYHDMGLIGSWLAALCFGIPIVILSPLAFLSRPARWLWALHAHRGTLSAAPNFAFELCVRKVADEEIRGLDLSAWRAAFNGAEPVSPETIERFTRRFAPYGFRPEAMCPVYGLAEAAAALTVPPLASRAVGRARGSEALRTRGRGAPSALGGFEPSALRLLRPRPARARSADRRPRRPADARAADRPRAGQGSLGHGRILPEPGGNAGRPPGRLDGLGRSRLPG
jgi:fatty-acyl-CoA synthase